MLSDEKIARISTAMAIVGVLLLFFSLQPEQKTISGLLDFDSNLLVSATAKVNWAKESGKSILFELDDGNKISAIIYNPNSAQKAILQKNSTVSVVGNVSEKNNKKFFVAKEVKKID